MSQDHCRATQAQVGSLTENACRESCSTRNTFALVSSKFCAIHCVSRTMQDGDDFTRKRSREWAPCIRIAWRVCYRGLVSPPILLIQSLGIRKYKFLTIPQLGHRPTKVWKTLAQSCVSEISYIIWGLSIKWKGRAHFKIPRAEHLTMCRVLLSAEFVWIIPEWTYPE